MGSWSWPNKEKQKWKRSSFYSEKFITIALASIATNWIFNAQLEEVWGFLQSQAFIAPNRIELAVVLNKEGTTWFITANEMLSCVI